MKKIKNMRINRRSLYQPTKKLMFGGLTLTALAMSSVVGAQTESTTAAPSEEIIVTGIRASLASALAEKRNAASLIEVIQAEDIGKLPDQNLAEVLENITGIQITRTAGVGSGVQIRGTNANRTEINGVATVGSGVVPLGSSNSDRSGINFEDINASIISSVEVTKSPEAKTVEGSVGGTINLKTIRPLELKETLGSIRIQGEDSSLSTEGIQPRIAGAFGDNWDTSIGRIGWVISGSYTEQEAVSFRPRADRDGALIPGLNSPGATTRPSSQEFDFLGIQFLTQEQENDDFETTNLATTFEWEPNENLKFYFDAFINEQERSRDQYRIQASGVSSLRNFSVPTEFETVDFGSFEGVDLGEIQAAVRGRIGNLTDDIDDPNLRISSETSSRLTDTDVFTLGTEFTHGRLSGKVEISLASSESRTPQLDVTTNFVNPNAPLAINLRTAPDPSDGSTTSLGNVVLDSNLNINSTADELNAGFAAAVAARNAAALLNDPNATLASLDTSNILNDNATPIIYDLTDGLSFGIDSESPFAPSSEDLLDASNYNVDGVIARDNRTETSDDQFKVDLNYAFDDLIVKSVDFGYRYNKAESTFTRIESIISLSNLDDSPLGANIAGFLVAGPSNFASGDGRELAITDFLQFNPDIAFSDQQGSIDALNNAFPNTQIDLQENLSAFYDISETTNAVYAQANFEYGIFKGNFGARYVSTNIDSSGFLPSGELETTSGSYDFLLPRLNISANVTDDIVIRFGAGQDIRRPDFRNLNTGFTFNANENTAVALGNPGTEPEEVDSIDLSVDWYFAPSAVASIGYFRKKRSNIFGTQLNSAAIDDATGFRETDPTCPGGGIFNPLVVANQLGPVGDIGLCVDTTSPFNDNVETTQTGIEVAFQYDLSSFEDSLGWASGFGLIANATFQKFSGGSFEDQSASRGTDILNASALNNFDSNNFTTFTLDRGLLDFSETAYNITVFYEKYGLSARARYTWREAFRTLDFAGGSSLNSTLGFPAVTEDRGQLNASINYDVTSRLNIGIEATNLTEEGVTQSCVNEGALTCFEGIPDRRITFGASYRF